MQDLNTPIFLKREWIQAFAKNILKNDQVLCEFEKRTSKSTIPFYFEKNTGKLSSLSNYYSPYFSNFEEGITNALDIENVLEQKQFSVLNIHPVTPELATGLKEKVTGSGFYLESYYFTKNWRHRNIQNFASFKAKCSANLIKSTERYTRKLKKDSDFRLVVYRNKLTEDILEDYFRVFNNSWKKPESHPDFLREIFYEAATLGQLRVGLIYHENSPVAAQVWFCAGRAAYIYKLAYDEEYAKYRVGNILTLELAKQCIEMDKVETIDFLTGEDKYKSKWMTECRHLYGVNIYNLTTIMGFMGAIKSKIIKAIKLILPIPRSF